MIKACEKASKILIRDFGELENLQVSKKGPKDFVTNADKKVEQVLIKELSKKKYSIISEEVGTIIKENNNNFWIIDPIDGTINFLHGIPHFCISLAFVSNNEIISGVIFDPIKNEMFYGEKNSGAFFNNQRIRVSKKNNLDDCLFASNLAGVKDIDINLRVSGSAALDLAYVASGRLDGFFQRKLNIWDIAAGVLILAEAGGKISPINIKKIKNHSIVASSEIIYKDLSNLLANF
jgi:myo-inositol-1(or 4)-monophosphatase|tara:strand:+ start:4900 stop:5604 length:705 start_codon:yes stop_codon:yes gene_type:complete